MRDLNASNGGWSIKSFRRIFKALRPYLWPSDWRTRSIILFALLALAASRFFALAAPFFYKDSVDAIAPSATASAVVPLAFILAYGAARFAIQLANYSRSIFFGSFLARTADDIRLRSFAHLHSLSLRFHLDRQTGGLTIAQLRGVNGMYFVLDNLFFNVIPTVIEIILVCIMLTKLYNLFYASDIVVTIALYIGCTHWLTEKRNEVLRTFNEADDRADTVAMDSLLNYETVKYFTKEEHELARFKDSRSNRYGIVLKDIRVSNNLGLLQGFIVTSGLVIAMIMAAHDVVTNQMKVGDYILINTYLLQLFLPLGVLGGLYIGGKRAFVDMEAMLALLDMPAEIVDAPKALPLKIEGGEIRFDNVRFGYGSQREILKGISFVVPAGKRVAIVGATGAGKSTIAKLLFRFYDVTGGRILIDGQDISRVTQSSLRTAMGIIPQDTMLFNDTIYYNIAYGYPGRQGEPDREAVERAAKLARIHDFIVSLPEGYDTRVGERGLKLSGGEKQRIAIARTVLKAPRIFLFDEATSALDNKTEAEIQLCLRTVSDRCTTLVIAHRLSTIIDADEIIVLDHGAIIERGSHDALLAKEGAYARTWHRREGVLNPVT
jgi:ATP-binding cassette, subfamily B, heavy metal transporter